MLRRFRKILSNTPEPREQAQAEPDLPRPLYPTYLVGDVHGRADLLEVMLELIDAHVGGTGGTDPRLVFVGNYVDHGPASPEVIRRLIELSQDFPENVICLMGNHERMLLDFLSEPALRGPRWLKAGGAATLKSYQIATDALASDAPLAAWQRAARELWIALGSEARAWLESRPTSWSSGNLWAVHAGADPQRNMDAQSNRVLLWGHPEFEEALRGDGNWVAYGHIERPSPFVGDGRIALNTGAWRSGQLTCCAVQPDGRYNFLQT